MVGESVKTKKLILLRQSVGPPISREAARRIVERALSKRKGKESGEKWIDFDRAEYYRSRGAGCSRL